MIKNENLIVEADFVEIKKLIDNTRHQALKNVNKLLVNLYWEIGEYIHNRVKAGSWGKSVVERLSEYLCGHLSDSKGFSAQNLWRMKQFFESYFNSEFLSPLVREISWSNNLIILSKTKTIQEREFYINLTIKENYSKSELNRQIDTSLFERVVLSKETDKGVLKNILSDHLFLKDDYIFEFLNVRGELSEDNLKKGLIENLKSFVLELGKDFLFVGEEYKVQVGKSDYYLDLLFYHRELACLVVFELKTGEFKPEYLGKINFYLEALDRDYRKQHENPSIGILLCKGNDQTVVEYALSRSLSPTLVAEYSLKLPDKKLLQERVKQFFN